MKPLSLLLAGLLGIALAACDQPRAQGDATAVIVAADAELWTRVEEAFRDGMEPTVQTVREERPFRLTHIDPSADEAWGQVRRFRRVVVMGSPDSPWVDEALATADEPAPEGRGVVRTENVWARGQNVWVLLPGEQAPEEAVRELATEVQGRMDEEFRAYARNRMYVSGVDSVLADSLAENAGFSLLLPEVYRYTVHDDTVFRFRNDNPSPRELIREIAVTWVEPAPEEDPSQEDLHEWRLQLTRDYYVDPQNLDTTVVSYGPVEIDGAEGVEFQSAWASLPEAWPAGGPFITRALRCPDSDRMYLMDGWVYAPNRDKYEYVIQIETILGSFRCR